MKDSILYKQLFDNLPDGITVQDLDLNIIYQNNFMKKAFGNRIGEKCFAAYEKRGQACEECGVLKVFETGEPTLVHRTAITEDGKESHWENLCFPLFEDGKVIAGVEFCRDVTDRKMLTEDVKKRTSNLAKLNDKLNRKTKQLEKALDERDEMTEKIFEQAKIMEDKNILLERHIRKQKITEEALRKERDFAESLIETAQAIVLVLDKKGSIVRFNRYMEELSGYKLEEVKGKDWFETFLSKRDRNNIRKRFAKAINGEQNRGIINQIIAKDGKRYELEWYDKTLRQLTGDVIGVLAIGQDITERAILQSQLAQAQKLEAIGQLAAGIAHEINTPTQFIGDNIHFLKDAFDEVLDLISRYSEWIEKCRDDISNPDLLNEIEKVVKDADMEYLEEEIPAAITQTLDGIDHVATIVRSMKEFSHPGGKDKVITDLNNAIKNTITVSRNEWKYVADIVTDLDPELPQVPVLTNEFNQVILNMIINATHAIQDVVGQNANKKGKITLSTRQENSSIKIIISDTGTGIPKEICEKIFDPFFTTKEVGKGTGQGLSIAHTVVVKKHGGVIDVKSQPGHGTTFTISLPFAPQGAG